MRLGRRAFIRTATLVAAASTALGRSEAALPLNPVIDPGAEDLRALLKRLATIPRRRDFKRVSMVLDDPSQWDDAAIKEVMDFKPGPKQACDNADLDGPWLNLMRNSLNTQIFSFKHPNFLIVSATHSSAHLALYDQAMWDKYELAKLAGGTFKTNILIVDKPTTGDMKNYEDTKGAFSPAGNTIPALMRRGVVFMGCHNSIWEHAQKLVKTGTNPDKLSHEALAAELTNHLIEDVVLTPGMDGTLTELQTSGFAYIK